MPGGEVALAVSNAAVLVEPRRVLPEISKMQTTSPSANVLSTRAGLIRLFAHFQVRWEERLQLAADRIVGRQELAEVAGRLDAVAVASDALGLDLLLQHHQAGEQRFWTRRAARHVDIDRHDLVDA